MSMYACMCVCVCICVCVSARVATVSYRGRGYIPAKAVMPAPIWLARHRQEPSHESPVIDMRPHSERFARGGRETQRERERERGREREREREREKEEEVGGGGGGGGGGGLRHLSPR